jgi:hypothetical protein
MRSALAFALLLTTAAAAPARAQVQPRAGAAPSADDPHHPHSRVAVELTTLNLLRQKGLITQDELDSSVRDLGDSLGAQIGDAPTLVLGRWSTTLYGFVEADHIFDTTESFNDAAGNAQVARTDSYGGRHDRFMFGVRNSRIGFRLRAPEYHRIRASAMLEMDFLGNQPPGATEAALFTNPGFRIRHVNLKVETPIVDVLIGQYWQLFGWQSAYQPNTVEIQGVPGEVYGRTPQLRLSKTIKRRAVTIEFAAAIMRPPQRDSGYPEGQAGARLAINRWTGLATTGSTGTAIQPLSVAVTADVRRFSLPEFTAAPKSSVDSRVGWGIAADALVPILRARADKKGNALTLNAEYAYGYGTADLYSGLNGGVAFASLPNPTMATPAPTYTPNVDPGLVVFNADGTLHLIQWESYLIGAQYYFPGLNGRSWVSANYSHTDSNNAALHGAANKVRTREDWFDVNLFGDVTPAVRLGLEYAFFRDQYADGNTPINHRVQLSAFYLF